MLRSLYSGVSGMKGNQIKMDVISNNIANASTTGFKSGRAKFQDLLSQTITDAATNKNAKQIGLGVKVGGIDNNFEAGGLQYTGSGADFAIEDLGDATYFLKLSDGTYTRDGAFSINTAGDELVTPDGLVVEGATVSGGTINMSAVEVYTFDNPAGLTKVGNNRYKEGAASGTATPGTLGTDCVIREGFLEMSNVDLANEFTDMIVTSRAYQANSRSITTSDEMLQELINLKR